MRAVDPWGCGGGVGFTGCTMTHNQVDFKLEPVSGVTLQQTYGSLTRLLTTSGRSSHEVARGCRTIDPTGLERKTGGFTRWPLLRGGL